MRATPFDLALLQAYDAKYLLGDIRDDFRTGLWCSTHINAKLKDQTPRLHAAVPDGKTETDRAADGKHAQGMGQGKRCRDSKG